MFALAIFRLVSALVLGEFLSIDKCPGDPFFDLKKRAPRSLVKSEPKVEICQLRSGYLFCKKKGTRQLKRNMFL